jgi:Ca-activated chloride channel family protein
MFWGPWAAAAGTPGQFAARVNTVEVYTSVFDTNGAPVRGLTAADFDVQDNGEPQRVTVFTAGELPLSVAVAIDRSFSVTPARLQASIAAARTFIEALRPADRVMVVTIGSEVETAAPLSPDHTAAMAALARIDRWGTTPLYDAMLTAIDTIQSASGRRALILLSDGRETDSRTTAASLIDHVRRQDVLVYPIDVSGTRPPVFAETASVTGGRSVSVSDPKQLGPTLRGIADELRFQYLLGYSLGTPAAPGEWHSIRVTVHRENVRVRARDGYVSR